MPKPLMPLRRRAAVVALALLAAAGGAVAHDTWFAPQAGGQLRLGTGNQFPVHDVPIATEYLPRQACVGAAGALPAMAALGYDDTALRLQPPAGAQSCWVQSTAFDVELPVDKIPVYLNEVRPNAAMLAAWAGIKARGLPWRERYVKHARIELAGPGTGPAPVPSGLGMDMLLQGDRRTLVVGDSVTVQLLRDGQPLPEMAVEWRNDRGRIGLWQKTDAQGRVTQRLPLPGQWLLRTVDLRLSTTVPDTFDSRFMTLAIEVLPR